MPRPPKAPKNQRSIDDLVLENDELDQALDDVLHAEAAAKLYREARQRIKAVLNNDHPELINAMTPAGKPRWIVVGNHRFVAQTSARPKAKKPSPAGTNWKFELVEIGAAAT